ncbi:MAG: hypothetical protein IJN32_03595, partial [Thermoguttaceae bacterium]|nr:hypothetical protein [Thermoguttaceae bacterium]
RDGTARDKESRKRNGADPEKAAIKKAARLATNRLLRQLKPLESNGWQEQTQLSSLQSIFS